MRWNCTATGVWPWTRRLELLCGGDFGIGAVYVGSHPGGGVGYGDSVASDHRWEVVSDYDAVEVDLSQSLHHCVHVVVAVVDEGLDEVGERGAHVAEVDFPDLAHLAEILDRRDDVGTHQVSAFEPGSYAEADANVW